jgi:hypothetical protein
MKLLFGRLLATAWYCQHLLVVLRVVSGRGGEEDDEEDQLLRPTAEWLNDFYSDIDNVLVEGHLTPSVSDLPDLPVFLSRPTRNDADESKPATTTRPPEFGSDGRTRRKLGGQQQDHHMLHDPSSDDLNNMGNDGNSIKLGGDQQQDHPLLPGQQRSIGLNILFNEDGIPFTGPSPPDTSGDIGTDHYIQMANGGSGAVVRVLNKSNGSLNKTFTLEGLAAGGLCANGRGDPIVLFDQFASRWFLSEFASGGNQLCIYISTTDDASGTYVRYAFPTPNFPDYPKYGVWPDAYYIGTNEGAPAMYALERSQMLLGAPAKILRNAGPSSLAGFGFQLISPIDADGDLPPPTGPGLFARHVDDEAHGNYEDNPASDLFEIHSLRVNFTALTTSRDLLQTIEVNEFDSNTCGLTTFQCVRQPGSAVLLDPLREPVMNRPQYRNFGTHETIVATWMTDIGTNQHAFRWMELRKSAGESSWVVHQQNNFAPDASTNRWMSSPAMSKCGDMAIGFSVSGLSPVVNPGLRVTGRLSADPLNQLDVEVTLVDGAGPSNSFRWGDYAAMAVDPVDDYTFWFTSSYVPNSSGAWSTHISKFTMGTVEVCDNPVAVTSSPTASPGPGPEKDTCGIVRKLLGIC